MAEKELHKSRWWAYRWLSRFDKLGLEGLKDQPRSGSRPPFISEKMMSKIRQKLSENQSGWEAKQVMDLIHKKTGVRYHEVRIYRLLHRWGILTKGASEEVCKYSIRRGKKGFQKGVLEALEQIQAGFTIAVQDESIFVHDVIVKRKLWLPKGVRPVATMAGSHQRTCVFGTLTMEGKQLFRQYDVFNQYTFLDYLKQVRRRLGKVIMLADRARQHRSKKVLGYLEDNKDAVRIVHLPKGSPEFNAVEGCCWRQGKHDLQVSKYYPKFTDLKSTISRYYRTRRFNLDVVKYLLGTD